MWLLSGGDLRALSSMFLCPRSGKSCSTSKILDGMAVGHDLIQQRAKDGNVPLSVAQIVDEAIFRFLFSRHEMPRKGAVRRPDTQIAVENEERFSQGGNYVLGTNPRATFSDSSLCCRVRLFDMFVSLTHCNSNKKTDVDEHITCRPRRFTLQRASRPAPDCSLFSHPTPVSLSRKCPCRQ